MFLKSTIIVELFDTSWIINKHLLGSSAVERSAVNRMVVGSIPTRAAWFFNIFYTGISTAW